MPFSNYSSAEGGSILIVNDAPDQLEWMAALLRKAGYALHTACDADSAFRLAETKRPTLILSDVSMPVKSGIELCRMIRSGGGLGDTPILLFSALRKDSGSAVEGLRAGANDYVEAPCDPELLLAKVDQLIRYRLAMEALLRSEDRCRDLIEHGNELICTHDLEGQILSVNPWASKVLGIDREALLGSNIRDILAPEAQAGFDSYLETIQRDGRAQGMMIVQCAGGEKRWWEYHNTLRADGVERPIVRGMAHDVTEVKQAEEKLRKSNERFELVARATNDAIWDWDLVTDEVWRNENFQTLFRYCSREAGVDINSWTSRVHTDDLRRVFDGIHNVIQSGGESWADEYRFLRGDGTYATVSDRGYVVRDWEGRPVRMVGSMMDITEQRRAEGLLRESETRLFTFMDALPLGVFVINAEGSPYYANRCARHLLSKGLVPDARRDKMADVYQAFVAGTGELYPAEKMPILRALAGEQTMIEDMEIRHPDRTVPLQVTAAPIYGEDGKISYAIAVFTDITERKRAEVVLRQQLDFTTAITSNLGEGVIAIDREGHVTFMNPAAEELLGWVREEMGGRVLHDVIHYQYADGRPHPVDECRVMSVLASGEQAVVRVNEDVFTRKDGSTFPVSFTATPILTQGEAIGAVQVFRDITERKQAEAAIQEAEAQLRQSQKMEAVGQLAGGIAHDFNNLLTAITGYTELSLRRLPEENPVRLNLAEILKASERAAVLTRQLLAFSRRQILKPKVLNLNAVVSDMEKMLSRLIGEDVELRAELDPELGHVKADPGQVEQVLLNLAVNARDAMPGGGKLTIETQNVYLDKGYTSRHIAVNPGPYVLLAVSDTGVGMDAGLLERIFEPFFTTKEQGKGTGLGLSTVYGIVKQSAGNIWVYSEPGVGTTFKIYLPRADEAAPTYARSGVRPEAVGGAETILLAEDDEMVRKFAKQILEERGYRVIETAGGKDAIQLAGSHEGEIHLLLTDVVMPEVSGRELAERLCAARPGLKVVYMSGYTADAVVRRGVMEEEANFIQKPFSPNDLLLKVREVLDGNSGVESRKEKVDAANPV